MTSSVSYSVSPLVRRVAQKWQQNRQISWPTEYRNKETGRLYKPHMEEEREFVYSDSPRYALLKGGEGAGKSVAGIIKDLERLKRGMNGILCCVAAETLVNGIPIAECTKPMPVRTIFGQRFATPSYCEGRADLFHVVTQSHEKVTVTANHRFLTPTGWHRLQDLHVGDLIAADDTSHELNDLEKQQGFLDYYLSGLHLYDELSSLSEQYDQDKLLLPALLIQHSYQTYGYLNRAYIENSFRLSFQSEDAKEYSSFYDTREGQLEKCDILPQFLLQEFPIDNLQLLLQNLSLDWLGGSDAETESDCYFLVQEKQDLLNSFQQDEQSLSKLNLHQKAQSFYCNHRSRDDQFSYTYYNRNIRFTQIESIAFQKYGEFYDLTVPSVSHYSANGLFHHNSPDLPHFKKSLWPEFQRWCPIHIVVPAQQYMLRLSWTPHEAFRLNFINGAFLICGGIEKPQTWEGPNVNFWHIDEGRHADAEALKVLDGRARIPGPNDEPPQGWITTTPKKNWLWEYFGPAQDKDKYLNFKTNSLVITLPLELNRENLADGYIENRRSSLTESEARVRVDAEWEDESDNEKFVNIFWWDACQEQLPSLDSREPAILVLDAATGSETTNSLCDCFAAGLITRHPHRKQDVAVRYCGIWQADPGKYLDFEPIENELIELSKRYSILELAYDPTQLHDMAMRFRKGSGGRPALNVKAFDQGKARLLADKQLQSLIMSRQISHDGNPLLKQHIDNADIKKYGDDGIRIVKRASSLKVDGAVMVAMGASRILYYNL